MQCVRSRAAGSVDRQNAPLVSLNSVVGGCRLATDLCLWRSEPDPSWLCHELTEQGSPIQTQRGWHQDEKSLSSEVVPNAHGLRAWSADPSDVRTLRSSDLGMVISEVVDGAPVPHGMVRSARPLAWRVPCAGTVERRGSRRRSSPGTCAYPPHAVLPRRACAPNESSGKTGDCYPPSDSGRTARRSIQRWLHPAPRRADPGSETLLAHVEWDRRGR